MKDTDISLLMEKIDLLTRVVAFQAVKDKESSKEKAKLLDWLGLNRNEIARICGTSSDAVRALLSQAKNKSKK